jgi:hypothetical protein
MRAKAANEAVNCVINVSKNAKLADSLIVIRWEEADANTSGGGNALGSRLSRSSSPRAGRRRRRRRREEEEEEEDGRRCAGHASSQRIIISSVKYSIYLGFMHNA